MLLRSFCVVTLTCSDSRSWPTDSIKASSALKLVLQVSKLEMFSILCAINLPVGKKGEQASEKTTYGKYHPWWRESERSQTNVRAGHKAANLQR